MAVVLDPAEDSLILRPLIWLKMLLHLETLRLSTIIALPVEAQAV